MRIGYLMQQDVDIINPPFDGPANHVREVVSELLSRGHGVRILFGLKGKIWMSDDLKNFESVSVKWLDRGLIRLFERGIRRIQHELQLPYASFFESIRFAQACCQQLRGFDLFYERMSWGNYGGGFAARRCEIPLILENNGDHLFDLEMKGIAPTGVQLRLSQATTKRLVHSVSHTVVSGDGWRSQYINRWGVNSGQVTTVENGTGLIEILNRSDLRSFAQQRSYDRPVKVVYVGGFYPWHGIPILIRALATAVEKGVDVSLTAIGAGPGQGEATEMVNDLRLSDRVGFLGQLTVDEFAPLLASADVAVAPYCGWPEFSGLKIFDYKAAGLATIVSGENGQPTTIQHKKTGWIVPPCDVNALSEAIVELASDPVLRRNLGQAARLDAEKNHGWACTVEELEQIFMGLLSKKSLVDSTASKIELEEA